MVLADCVSASLNVLMLFLNYQQIFGEYHFLIESDLLIYPAFEGGRNGERLELCKFFVVEVDCAVFGPGEFKFVVFA